MTERVEVDAFLHVYGQYMWHDDALIKGTRSALLLLREAIDDALATSAGERTVFATDGEGYAVKVVCSSTVAGVGTPSYEIEIEHKIARQVADRWKAIAEPGPDDWDAPVPAQKEPRR